jgi:hypothetical protein
MTTAPVYVQVVEDVVLAGLDNSLTRRNIVGVDNKYPFRKKLWLFFMKDFGADTHIRPVLACLTATRFRRSSKFVVRTYPTHLTYLPKLQQKLPKETSPTLDFPIYPLPPFYISYHTFEYVYQQNVFGYI